MRAGACAVQQTLTAEAAGVVKHAVALAQQRGHAQVTPLHVAATLLAPGGMSLLRRACLKSHPHSTSHPLQCRALELCFKVALNRLPTSAGPLMHTAQPSLSNSLVAVLKRAQAHQRRGCLEQQQQPLLAMKVEIEQLIISILDDPSVSRVMREAGFSSTFVKSNIEDEVSVSVSVSANFPYFSLEHNHNTKEAPVSRSPANAKELTAGAVEMGCSVLYSGNSNNHNNSHNSRINFFESPAFKSNRSSGSLKSEDVERVFEVLLGKKTRKTNSVIVGDCFLTTENVVKEVMSRVERGDVPDPLKGVQFITPHFSALVRGEQVEQKLAELRRTVLNCLVGGSAIIYAGDLRWAVDVQENGDNNNINGSNKQCPVEHISMELGRILGIHGESRRVWLMATASYQTYMRCQTRQPSLENLFGLQAVPVPSGGLTLTLQPSSSREAEPKTNRPCSDVSVPIPQNLMRRMSPLNTVNSDNELVEKLNCCFECSANFEAEAKFVCKKQQSLPSSDRNLPFWLQQCRNDNVCTESDVTAQEEAKLRELRKKWNQTCRSRHCHIFDLQRSAFDFPHHSAGLVSSLNPYSPWWGAPQSNVYGVGASPNQELSVLSNTLALPDWAHNQLSWQTPENENCGESSAEHNAAVDESTRFDVETTLTLGLSDTPFKASNDDANNCTALSQLARVSSFRSPDSVKSLRQSDPESLKELSDRLSEKVPWQSEANIRAIASAVLHCRSGMVRRESRMNNVTSDTWLLGLGPDRMGKRKMAQALAKIIYGSQEKLICLGSPWSRGQIYAEDVNHSFRGKTYLDRLTQAISMKPHCVVLIEDIEQADTVFMGAIVKAMERGKLMDSNGREVSLSDTIVFMTSSLGAKYFTNCSMQYDEEKLSKSIAGPCCGFKLVVEEKVEQTLEKLGHHPCKRKVEWDPMQAKETEKRNRRSPALDLNAESDKQADDEAKQYQDGSMSGNSGVTEEAALPTDGLNGQILFCTRERFSEQFLNLLDKYIVFRPFDFSHLAETLLDKLHHSYCRATNGRGSFEVDSSVVERMVSCCWELAPLGTEIFLKWVEEIFEVGLAQMLSMQTLTANTTVKLSKAETNDGDSFYGNSHLPTRIEFNSCSNCQSIADEFTVCRMHKHLSSTKALIQVHV